MTRHRLIHQTRTRNVGVNTMVDKFVPIAETVFVENPDGVALQVNSIFVMSCAKIPRLFLGIT
jgi:hypothetical protein